MYQDMFDLKDRVQEAMHNPALALRNGLARLPEKIKKKEKELKKLRDDLSKLDREARERSRENRRGLFGRRKEPGFFASLGEDLDNWALDGTRSSVEETEAELNRLREFYNELKRPLYPEDKQWGFVEVDQEITRLYNQFAGAHSTLEQAGSTAMTLMPSSEDKNNPWASLAGGLQQMSITSATMDGMEDVVLRMCQLALGLDRLYAIRRTFLPAVLSEIGVWDKARVTAELQRRKRDLDELPSESEVLSRQLSELPIKYLSPEMMKRSPLYAVFGEQRRFLQDVVFELEAALERLKITPKPSDPMTEALNQIKELRRKMDAALANETDEDIREDIKRAYGKKIDALRENL